MSKQQITEEWRDVVGHEGWYSISNYGKLRIEKTKRTAGRIIRPVITRDGYERIGLYKGHIQTSKLVHCMVLEAFHGLRPDGHQCNHKDRNKRNNFIGNLEWCTPKENVRHLLDSIGRRAERQYKYCPLEIRECQILQIRQLAGFIGIARLAYIFEMSRTTVRRAIQRKTWKNLP